jgi:soluble lytic murein transglycosylase-like protein
MKKLLLFLFLMFSSFGFTSLPVTNAENGDKDEMSEYLTKQIEDLKTQMYLQSLIQYIELESEVIIPKYLDTKYVEFIYNTANQNGVPVRTAFRLVFKESSFRDTVTSPMGAGGLMQLMPDTRKLYREILRTDTLKFDKNQEDIYIGIYMVKDLYNYWVGRGNSVGYSWKLSLASYNAGKGTVIYYKGIPPIGETTDFIAFILKAHSNPSFYASYLKKYGNDIKNHA